MHNVRRPWRRCPLLLRGFLALYVITGFCVADDSSDVEWFAVMLNGAKTGHMRAERRVRDGEVVTEQLMSLNLDRMGVSLNVETMERHRETASGEPLGFETVQKTSGMSMTAKGRIDEQGRLIVTSGTPGSEQTRTLEWPEDALLAEGLRLASLDQPLTRGAEFTLKAYVPSALQAFAMDHEVVGEEAVDLFGRELTLTRVEQRMTLGSLDTTTSIWIDDELHLQRMTMDLMGMRLDMKACPEQCALSENEPTEFFVNTLARAPAPLTDDMRQQGITYRLSPRVAGTSLHFPVSSEQAGESVDGGWTLQVTQRPAGVQGLPYTDDDPVALAALEASDWIQSDAPDIQALAKQAAGDAGTAAEAMTKLEAFVAGYVNEKSLSVGYASALEVLQTRAGDCTEHALLLAALGRALGVPTRVATGIAYVDTWIGMQDTFVPHAWAQAYIDGQWISYDAALGGFGAGHIALGYGDGDPWNFYDGALTLGNLQIDAAAPLQ